MAEPQSPQETSVPSQKRPLEEPSSPSGPDDGPHAKRPALDKILNDDLAAAAAAAEQPTEVKAGDETAEASSAEPAQKSEDFIGLESKADITSIEKPEDTVVPDAPAATNSATGSYQILETQPVQSNHANGATESHRAGSQAPHYDHRDETGWLHVRAIITSAEAATTIGKGGENVSQIRRMAGAKCTVSEYSRGAVERVLTVSGLVDAVAKALGLIVRTLNQEPLDQPSTPQSKTYPLRLLIPHILIGSIIGKQGIRIREIQEASGARLNASEACLPLSTERSLVVLGVADAIHIATYYVGSTLVEQLTERFGGPAASAYAVRHGGPQGVLPGGMQVVPYVPQHAGGQMGHPDNQRRPNYQSGRPPAGQYGGGGYQGAQQPQQQQAPQAGYGAASPRAPYIGAGPQAPHGYSGAGPANPAHAGPPQQPVQGGPGFPGQPITQQIFIPNDMVGAIIGKGGAKINEIRQLSGSVIKINEPQDNNNERLVTITGTQECNQMALYMLYSRLVTIAIHSTSPLIVIRSTFATYQTITINLDPPSDTEPVWFRSLPRHPTTPNQPIRAFAGVWSTAVHPAMAMSMSGVPSTELPSPTASDLSTAEEAMRDAPPAAQEQGRTTSRPRSGRASAKIPLRSAFRTFTGCATVLVGSDATPTTTPTGPKGAVSYLVHKELLCSASPFFAAALNSTFAEGLDQTVRLPEEKPEVFEWFLQWLYTGSLTTPGPAYQVPHLQTAAQVPGALTPWSSLVLADAQADGELRNHAGSPKYFLLIDLYGLSDRLLTTPLSNHILSTIARLSEATNSVPTPSDTRILYEQIRATAPLKSLILDLFAYKKTDKLLATHKDEWHAKFLRELVVKLKRPGPEGVERHTLVAWRPSSYASSRACEGCREVLKPGVSHEKCVGCERAFCGGCFVGTEVMK
nr:hypothetical protein B0A51_14102 [Rachicladosporium sp. CCFEE 5018]